MVRITKRIVDQAEPRGKRYTVFDEDVRGFGLRVTEKGAKSYVFEYRPGGGGRSANKKRLTIAKVGDMTPDRARKIAEDHRILVKLGKDPMGEKDEWRKAMTVNQVADEFLKFIKKERSPNTYNGYEGLLRLYVRPNIGSKKARDVTHADVERIRLSLEDRPATANSVLRVLSSMYNFAANNVRQWVPKRQNPTEDIERFPELERRVKINPDELARLGDAIRVGETVGLPWKTDPTKASKHLPKNAEDRITLIDPFAAAALRLLMFTGARLREILRLQWKDVDLENNLIVVKMHKTARQSGEKEIVLNGPARQVLERLAENKIGVYVIASDSAGEEDEQPRHDLKRPWDAVRSHAGLDHLRIHDLRHIFAGVGAGSHMGLPVIGKLLGHANASSTERYAHLQRDPQQEASNKIAAMLALALGEVPPATNQNKRKRSEKRRGA